jgi:O-antigen ligase
MFAYYMGMAVPIGLLFVARAETDFRRWLFLLCVGVVVFADLLSFSRGGYLGLISGAVYLGTAFFFGYDARKKLFAAIILLASALALFFPGSPFGSRISSMLSLDEGSNQGRIATWKEAVEKIAEKPILGYGSGNYPLAVKPDASQREPIYAHNLPLDIATEVGIFGAALFLFASVSALLSLTGTNPMIAASLIVFFGHSLVETPLYSVHVFPIFLLLLAFGSVSGSIPGKRIESTDQAIRTNRVWL